MKPLSKNILSFLVFFLVVSTVFSFLRADGTDAPKVGMNTIAQRVQAGEVKSLTIRGTEITAVFTDETEAVTRKEGASSVPELLSTYGVTPEQLQAVTLTVEEGGARAYVVGVLLPNLIPLLLLLAVFWFMLRQLQGANNRAMSFGQSGAREFSVDEKNRVTFADVAGAKEAKAELAEEVDFLKNPKKFVDLGAKLPKGVLLMGHPGTGKTLLARAVAGEANVPFFHISGSEFVEMFVGVGASRVRDLFAKAKKHAPCIIFIDEIDAVGRQRGSGLGGSHDEREQTLNQILVEMDGFDPNSGVIVIAATNRPDVLDPALLRPGRFDRRVMIDLPDIHDREAILSIHGKNKPLDAQVNLRRVAERTPGFSGADLMNVLNEAAIRTARENRTTVLFEDIADAIEKVLLGPVRKSHILSEKERKVTAYHEGGHALVAASLPHADPVHKVSIISRGRAAGYTMKLPVEDKKMESRAEFLDDLAVMLGGYAAEEKIFGDITTGPSDDLKRATKLARQMVTRFGMTNLGARTFGEQEEMIFLGREIHEQRDYAEATAEKIDTEVSRLVQEALETARGILLDKAPLLDRIASVLMEKETLERDEFDALIKGA